MTTTTEGMMTMTRTRITAYEAAADPTNLFEVRVSGDTPVAKVEVHGTESAPWLFITYASGGTSAGTPPHYHTFVRITD